MNLLKYIPIALLTGCTVSANVDTESYDCSDAQQDIGDFVIECTNNDHFTMSACLSASKQIFCKRLTDECKINEPTK